MNPHHDSPTGSGEAAFGPCSASPPDPSASVMSEMAETVVGLDEDWRITFLNAAAAKALGQSEQDVIGCVLWDLAPAVCGTPLEEMLRRAMSESTPAKMEYYHTPQHHWYLVRAVPTPSNLLVFSVDITHWKLTEQAWRDSEAWLSQAMEGMAVAIYTTDAEGRILRYNEKAAEVWGCEPKPGDTEQDFFASLRLYQADGSALPPEQYPMANVLRHGTKPTVPHEATIERADGSRVTVLAHPSPIRNEQGQLIGAINCFVEITERKASEEALAYLAAIIESSEDAIISKDLTGRITSWNHAATLLFGYEANEMIGQPISQLMPPERRDEMHQILGEIREGKSIEHFHTQRLHKRGHKIDVSLSVSPIKNNAGQVVGAAKIVRNITKEKRAEEAQSLEPDVGAARRGVHHRTGAAGGAIAGGADRATEAEQRERKRLAQVLHDELQQLLVGAKMQLGTLRTSPQAGHLQEQITQVENLLHQAIDSSRSLSSRLVPPVLYEMGLGNWRCTGWRDGRTSTMAWPYTSIPVHRRSWRTNDAHASFPSGAGVAAQRSQTCRHQRGMGQFSPQG